MYVLRKIKAWLDIRLAKKGLERYKAQLKYQLIYTKVNPWSWYPHRQTMTMTAIKPTATMHNMQSISRVNRGVHPPMIHMQKNRYERVKK